jgi:hypothetical protein
MKMKFKATVEVEWVQDANDYSSDVFEDKKKPTKRELLENLSWEEENLIECLGIGMENSVINCKKIKMVNYRTAGRYNKKSKINFTNIINIL